MAHYTVVYSCGHEGVIQLTGPGRDREWRLKREVDKVKKSRNERLRKLVEAL